MKLIKKYIGKLSLISYLLLVPAVSFALINNCNPAGGKLCNPIAQDTIQGFLKSLLEGVLKIGIPVIVLAIIYCGFLFVKARGNSEELSKAKDALLYTLIGTAILLGSWALAELINTTVTSLGS